MFAPRNHNSISSAAAASACSSSYPELLQTQLRALVRLAQRHDLRILVPMVTLAEEMERMRGLLRQAAGDLGVERLPPLGAMIETPAALCAAQIAIPIADCGLRIGKEVRSAEFGVRSDRHGIANCGLFTPHFALRTLHLKVSHYFMDDHPAVMRLVEMVVREAAETPVGLCGELAGRKEVLPQLLGLGLRSLSVAPPLVPQVKDLARSLRITARVPPGPDARLRPAPTARRGIVAGALGG